MSGARKSLGPPSGEPFVWLTRELLQSEAWRSLGINARRFMDFLMLEHMAHGGKHNGRLKAPHRQLEVHGISARYVSNAIREAEEAGLVIACRGGMRTATTYQLTWQWLHDGSPPSDDWKHVKNGKSAQQREGNAGSQREGRSSDSAPQREGRNGHFAASQKEGALKRSYQGRCDSTGSS
jgi:hypothetical protein